MISSDVTGHTLFKISIYLFKDEAQTALFKDPIRTAL